MAALKTAHIVIGGAALLIVAMFITFKSRLINVLASFIPSVEGFREHPYWDVSRYSWGYGTAAPGPTGTITREQAFAEMTAHLLNDYETLKQKVTRGLSVNQWAALLSFSYNLGIGNALKIVPYVNDRDDQQLAEHWMEYVHAGGQVSQTLVDRRQRELSLFTS